MYETYIFIVLLAMNEKTIVDPSGAIPQRVSTEIINEIKQFNTGRMASHASIESIWCTHRRKVFTSKMDF